MGECCGVALFATLVSERQSDRASVSGPACEKPCVCVEDEQNGPS